MSINKVLEVYTDFKFSWGSAGLLTLSTPLMEQLLPLIIQITVIVSLQVISIGVDMIRKKYKLKLRDKDDISIHEMKGDKDK